jgi:uncharacterized protein YlxP (DUF503 family)
MNNLSLGILTIHLYLPGVHSLKQKRSQIKPLLLKLHREFNLSAAEIGHLDSWNESLIACAIVSNDPLHNQRVLQKTAAWLEASCPEMHILEQNLELI